VITRRGVLEGTAAVALGLVAGAPARAANEGNAELAMLAGQRIDGAPGVGAVIGTIDHGVAAMVSRGETDGARGLDQDTVFEIGSITKVFTGTLLADMVARGEVALTDPIDKHLPSGVTAPSRNGKHITLLDLATQTSGLPRLPTNFAPAHPNDPYADYSVEKLYDFLAHYQLTRDPGGEYEYSNLGVGLLGQLLANRAKTSYATLVYERILHPLEMDSTGVGITRAMFPHLAVGHDADGERVSDWMFEALAGAGGLRSSLRDMMKFLSFNMKPNGALAAAVRDAQTMRKPISAAARIGLAWQSIEPAGTVWHNGKTGGYQSFIGMSTDRSRGVVALANGGYTLDDVGFHWLDPSSPLAHFYHALSIDPKLLATFAGAYALGPAAIPYVIVYENGRLYAKLGEQPRFPIYPYAANAFFYKVVDAQLTFVTDANGHPTGFVLHQNGQDVAASRTP